MDTSEQYITIEAKSDDCADPNPPFIYEEEPLTKEELRQEYWPFFEEPIKRRNGLMDKRWRPPGWESLWDKYKVLGSRVDFEAGADAVLEAVKAEGEHFEWDTRILRVNVPRLFKDRFKGTFVFIPDEEQDK